MNPCGVKVINDWFNIKDARMPDGLLQTSFYHWRCRKPTDSGGDDAGDGLARDVYTIGVLGIFLAIGWYTLIATAST